MLFLRCPFCKSPTNYRTAENATYVIEGDPVCFRLLCRERARAHVQTVEKCLELGLPPPLTAYLSGAP